MRKIRQLGIAMLVIAALAICFAPRKAESIQQPAAPKAAGFPAKEIVLEDGTTAYEFTVEFNPRVAVQGAPRPVATLGMKIPGN
jgi:hypothetical protein